MAWSSSIPTPANPHTHHGSIISQPSVNVSHRPRLTELPWGLRHPSQGGGDDERHQSERCSKFDADPADGVATATNARLSETYHSIAMPIIAQIWHISTKKL